jgi:Carboxypeptidase regulatory-like domain
MPRVIAPVLMFAASVLGQTTGSVEGAVVDRVTGAGIPGASVTFYIRTQQGAIVEATTDASGEFRIFGMKPGSYEVRFEKEGYRFGNKTPPQPYIVGQSPSPVQIRLEMTRMVTLSGRVVDPDGNPISQGEVKLANRIAVPVAADGTFTIKELEPGSYTLAAIPKPTRVLEGARVPVITAAPEPIVIHGDADISGYEIRLETAEVYRVSGVVLDETGNPKPKVLVQLLPRLQSGARITAMGDFMTVVGPGPYIGPAEARVVSGEDGSFEFPAVRSGEWQVATGLAGQTQIDSSTFINTFHNGATSVIVGNHSVENLQIRQAPSFKMSATVEWGDAVPSRLAGVSLAPTDGRVALTPPPNIDQNRTMTFPSINPGQYLILPRAGPGFYPVSVLLDGQEVLGKPTDLFPGSSFRVTYKAANGSVHGAVDNCNGAGVVLVPREVRTMAFGRMVTCKSDGTFEISGVPPGDYYAAALLGFQFDDTRDPRWLAAIASIGTPVSVAQSSVSVQLKSNRWPQ